ncbi:MAG: DUF1152 domain-containing protein [Candidatus Schekmanbacteria bacterium]|nr:DUF1152 domain-containing protein [Candidatus Schekmanbacteria bacterium]
MAHSGGENDWLDAAFACPPLAGRKVLVLGLGGGSDIIAAYAVAHLLRASRPASMIYANTKKRDDGTLLPVTAHISRVAAEPSSPAEASGPIHGSTLIDRAVPRGDEGCPWIFLLGDSGSKAEMELPGEIRQCGFDVVFGVDIGGDSLVPSASSGKHGRDKRMLEVLQHTRLPLLPVVVSPGADGESTYEELLDAFRAHRRRVRGSVPLDDPALELMRSLSVFLDPDRTPRIILAAAEDRLQWSPHGGVVVPRGRYPSVPRAWLLRALVFADDDACTQL